VKRILFVDDEPNILDGLKRMLRSQRRVWNMEFASSGEEALSAMAVEPFDVVVTDIKMPGMNGAELLAQVQDRHPRTVRIVLSGHADMEASMRSVSVSHQCIAKPCDADTLKSIVARACGLEALLQEPSLQEALGSVTDLPVLPRAYKALTVALAKEEVDIQEVGDIVEQDAGIAAKILQLVNSSFFGIRWEITDLRQATIYLGVTTIRDLVLSFELFQQFEDSAKLSGFSIEREQSHSLLTARIAQKLLDEKSEAEQAFLAGMLHDVGKLVLATRFTESFQTVLQAGAGVERPFCRVEEEILGVSHAEIGAYLLALWGISYPVVEAVAHHHHPARVSEQTAFGVLAATHVADCLAREQGGCEPDSIELDEQYLQALGVADKLPKWRAIAEAEAHAEHEGA
jgi:putative nucleotidyltransferase with HDIG domain